MARAPLALSPSATAPGSPQSHTDSPKPGRISYECEFIYRCYRLCVAKKPGARGIRVARKNPRRSPRPLAHSSTRIMQSRFAIHAASRSRRRSWVSLAAAARWPPARARTARDRIARPRRVDPGAIRPHTRPPRPVARTSDSHHTPHPAPLPADLAAHTLPRLRPTAPPG